VAYDRLGVAEGAWRCSTIFSCTEGAREICITKAISEGTKAILKVTVTSPSTKLLRTLICVCGAVQEFGVEGQSRVPVTHPQPSS
jgi:hypothetical protein